MFKIELGDFYLITTKSGREYEAMVIGISETSLTIENWNEVKDRQDEIDIPFNDIVLLEGFNDSQTTV